MRKEQGGMGFRDLHFFNLAMLGKHGWNFVSNLHTRAIHGRVDGQRNPSLKWGVGGV